MPPGESTHSFAQHDLRRLDRRGSDVRLQDTRLQKSLEGLMGNDRTDISAVLTHCLSFEKAPPSIGKITAQTGARSWFLLLLENAKVCVNSHCLRTLSPLSDNFKEL